MEGMQCWETRTGGSTEDQVLRALQEEYGDLGGVLVNSAAITNYHRQRGLNNENLFLTVLEAVEV